MFRLIVHRLLLERPLQDDSATALATSSIPVRPSPDGGRTKPNRQLEPTPRAQVAVLDGLMKVLIERWPKISRG